MKKFFAVFLALFATLSLVACGKSSNSDPGKGNEDSTPTPSSSTTTLNKPVLTLTETGVTWTAVENAKGYVVKCNDTTNNEQTDTFFNVSEESGKFEIKVKAISADSSKYKDSSYSDVATLNIAAMTAAKLYVLGDSTSCNYLNTDGTMVDNTFYYPRFGFGMELSNYFKSSLTIVNLAMSGRTTATLKSDTSGNYDEFKNNIKAGDYALIAFGHNDQKAMTVDQFKSNLYNDYVKVALDKGAYPIIVTPIVRLSTTDDFTGDKAHIVSGVDWRQANIDVATQYNVPYVDLTTITKNIYTTLGYAEAKYYHAMSTKLVDKTDASKGYKPNDASPDGTHLNQYGAKMVASEFAKAIKETSSTLKGYANAIINSPTRENDLVMWKNAKASVYTAPELTSYSPSVSFFQTTTSGWYGTAFGNVGGDAYSAKEDTGLPSNGYYAQETSSGVYKVGQYVLKDDGSANVKGKFENNGFGGAYLFKQISVNDNFTLTVSAKVTQTESTSNKQSTFGLMLRDDVIVNQPAANKAEYDTANFAAADIYKKDGGTIVFNAKYEGGKLEYGTGNATGWYVANDTATFTITRESQKVTLTTVYKGETYTTEYLDLKLNEVDENYMYVGMFANRCTLVEFTNLSYTRTGTAVQA